MTKAVERSSAKVLALGGIAMAAAFAVAQPPMTPAATPPKPPAPAVRAESENAPPRVANEKIARRSLPPLAIQQMPHLQPRRPAENDWSRLYNREMRERLPLPVFAKISAPQGSQVTFYAAGGKPFSLATPTVVGLRARHRYAFSITKLPNDPTRVYFGSIEVLRGPQVPADKVGSDFPVPIHFADYDSLALFKGTMLSKFVVTEKPGDALAVQGDRDFPIVFDSNLEVDPYEQAKRLGRVMLVVRLGDRVPTRGELAEIGSPGALMVPNAAGAQAIMKNEKPTPAQFVRAETEGAAILQVSHKDCDGCNERRSLPPAACLPGPMSGRPGMPPMQPAPWMIQGPMPNPPPDVYEDEYVCDGGDRGKKVSIDPYGKFENLDPGDTIARFEDREGRTRIVPSTIACAFAPRYAELRFLQNLEAYERLVLAQKVTVEETIAKKIMAIGSEQRDALSAAELARSRQRASGYESTQWSSLYSEVKLLDGMDQSFGHRLVKDAKITLYMQNVDQLFIQRNIEFARVMSRDQHPQLLASGQGWGEVYGTWRVAETRSVEEKPGRPARMKLEKTVQETAAKPGDVLTFVIRYTNLGDESANNVAVVDSLPVRLDYVPNSATSGADAIFTSEPNEVGSQTLRWELKNPVKGKQSGTVQFKAKVR